MPLTTEINREALVSDSTYQPEAYGHSLSTLRYLGNLAVNNGGTPEHLSTKELAYIDFETAVAEMLKTDVEFRGWLDVDNERTHKIVDGQVLTTSGLPIISLLENGVESSRLAASKNPAFESQAVRDMCDIEVAKMVEALKPGTTWIGVSFYPKQAMQQYPEIYKDQLGYREGLIYIQTYSKLDEQTLVTGSYSADTADEASWRQLLAEFEMEIPETASHDTWLLYGTEFPATPEEAKTAAHQLRDESYRRLGKNHSRRSINQYVEQKQQLVRQLFDTYYDGALAQSVYTGHNNLTLRGLATTLLAKDIEALKPEIKQQLKQVASSEDFDSEASRTMDSVIRYAVVEELRKGLKQFTQSDNFLGSQNIMAYYPTDPGLIHNLLATNVQSGVRAQRAYGGCPGQVELGKSNPFEVRNIFNQQETFGGLGDGQDKYGSLKFKCPNGHINTRESGELIDKCQHHGCKAQVACGPKDVK